SGVPTVTVVKPALRRTIDQPGTIEAFQQTPVYAKIPGFVDAVAVDIGDRVYAGDDLAQLYVPEMKESLRQKEALAEQSRAEVTLAQRALEAARASFETATAAVEVEKAGRARTAALVKRWQSEVDRLKTVVRSGSLARQELDETEYQFAAAQASAAEVEMKV